GPAEVVAYLEGRLPGYEEATTDSIGNFSAADILETMDTIVLDRVRGGQGEAALDRLYSAIARAALDSLLDVYGGQPVLVPLDAGHGGKRSYYWDPGSEGTEWLHARAVVAAMEALAERPEYATITLRRVYNDDVADDYRVPDGRNVMVYNQVLTRLRRASMLAYAGAVWNADHADQPESQLAVHELSVHFNAGANGLLVLHQGNVDQPYRERSLAYAK